MSAQAPRRSGSSDPDAPARVSAAAEHLRGKVAVVTGATGGMGRVIALELVRRGATVVTIARDACRAADLAQAASQLAGPGSLSVVDGDLTRRADVVAAARRIADEHPAVHLLINNAGAHFPRHALSVDGVEMHIALNYLAGVGLTGLLAEQLSRGHARVVNVASDTLNDTRQMKILRRPRVVPLHLPDLDDVRALNPADGFVPFEAYARAKLLLVIAGFELADRLAPRGVTVNAVHPGIVATDIVDDVIPRALKPVRGLIRRGMLSPEDGARAALRLATDPALASTTGVYVNRDREAATPPVSHDPDVRRRACDAALRHFGLHD